MAKRRGSKVQKQIGRGVTRSRGAEEEKIAFQRHPLAAERDAYPDSSYPRAYLDGSPQRSCAFCRLAGLRAAFRRRSARLAMRCNVSGCGAGHLQDIRSEVKGDLFDLWPLPLPLHHPVSGEDRCWLCQHGSASSRRRVRNGRGTAPREATGPTGQMLDTPHRPP
jgi:hypothetical protein